MRSNDKLRLDWLEELARVRGGVLLHNGTESGRLGIGLAGGRGLREAIDTAMGIRSDGGAEPEAAG